MNCRCAKATSPPSATMRAASGFSIGMLGAQAAVIIATLAMASRQRNLLWSVAALAGLVAVALAIYVYFCV